MFTLNKINLVNLLKNKELFKYLKNTSWMISDKIAKMFLILSVNIFLARYLSIEEFGYLSYAISLVSIFTIATHMGLSGLVVKELVNTKNDEKLILGTVFGIKFLGALLGFIILFIITFFSEDSNGINFYIMLIISLSIFFKPFEVIDFWFISKVKAKYSAKSNIIAIFISSIIKISFVLMGMSFLWFGIAHLIEAILIASLFVFYYHSKYKTSLRNWYFSFSTAKYLLSKAWLIMLGSIFAIIYLKIDQVMLQWIVGSKEVGIYSIAASLSEVWYFLPSVIVTSLFPKIIEVKEKNIDYYNKRLQQLFDLLFSMALIIAIIVSVLAKDVIVLLYGEVYTDSAIILSIHIWASLFIFMRALFSKWIILEDVLVFSLITQGLGGIFNILLNFILIPQYGAIGAAIATLISYAIASYLSLAVYSKTRGIFLMMSKSMISPIRYTIQFYKKDKS